MTYIQFDTETGRIERRIWGDVAESWVDNAPERSERTHEPGFSHDSRDELMRKANAIHEAGEDYDPETETSVGYLTYDAETGRIEPAAEIRELPTDE